MKEYKKIGLEILIAIILVGILAFGLSVAFPTLGYRTVFVVSAALMVTGYVFFKVASVLLKIVLAVFFVGLVVYLTYLV